VYRNRVWLEQLDDETLFVCAIESFGKYTDRVRMSDGKSNECPTATNCD